MTTWVAESGFAFKRLDFRIEVIRSWLSVHQLELNARSSFKSRYNDIVKEPRPRQKDQSKEHERDDLDAATKARLKLHEVPEPLWCLSLQIFDSNPIIFES